jgi:Flp pilus assembly CpaE family ATPase
VSSPNGQEGFSPDEFAARVEILEGSPVFCELPDRVLRQLARRMRRVELSAGETVVDVGEKDSSIYFVGVGLCESAVAIGVPTFEVRQIPAGESFGLGSAVLDAPQPFTVTTVEPSVLYVLTAETVRTTLEGVPGAIAELERLAAQLLESHRQAQLRATSTLLPRRDAVVIPVYSASGGSGRTTIALNLAAALAAETPGHVLLIDLSLPYAHAALIANLIPTGSLASGGRFSGLALDHALMSSALFHPSGMMVLPGTSRPDEAELVTPKVVFDTLAALKSQFSFIVVDMAVPLTEVAVTVFDNAQQVVLVLTPDLGALQGATEALKILDEAFGIPTQLVTIVLNNRSPKAGTSRDAIAEALGRPPDVEVRYDDSRPDRAALRGQLSFDDPRSSVREAVLDLVVRVNDLCVAPVIRSTGAGPVLDPGRI